MSGNKEQRSSNFCKEETNKLMMLLKDFPVITCKKTDHVSNKQKDAAWKLLQDKFNSDATKYRSIKQLQQKYNNMKKTARKEMAEEKYGRRLTGGGPPPAKPSETTEWLNSIIKESISGLPAIYDSDALENNNLNSDTEEVSNLVNANIEFIKPIVGDPLECLQSNESNLLDANATGLEMDVTVENEVLKDFFSNNDANMSAFDSSTPKSMLRKPVSKELVISGKKRKSAYTPLETRKQILIHTSKKNEFLSQKMTREKQILQFAEEEHNQNMKFMREMHEMEMNNKKQIHELILDKCKSESEKARLELHDLTNFINNKK